jgi:hypothetical protein
MITNSRLLRFPALALHAAVLFMVLSASVSAQNPPSSIPAHAQASPLGDGWSCERGFSGNGQSCVKVTVPTHAYLDSSGDDWDCDRGYLKAEDRCALVVVPRNAHTEGYPSLNGWTCDRGYQAQGSSCMAITVPSNG